MTIGSTGSSEASLARQLARASLAVDLGRFRPGCRRQGQDLPAGLSLLRLRGAASSVEPSGDRHRARNRERRNHHRDRQACDAGRCGLRQRDARPWPGARRHARRQHLPPRRGDLADAARAVGTNAAVRRDTARGCDRRLRGRRADRPRALYRRSGAALSADRPCRAAGRSAGGKPCAWSHRRCRDQRRFDCRQYIVGPERMAACRRFGDVLPSGLCRPQRHHGDRTRGSRRLRLGNHPRRRSRAVRGLSPTARTRRHPVVCRPQRRKSWPSTTSRFPPAILRKPPRRQRCGSRANSEASEEIEAVSILRT